jgi:hypothetical protein
MLAIPSSGQVTESNPILLTDIIEYIPTVVQQRGEEPYLSKEKQNVNGGGQENTTTLSITDCVVETDGCPCASKEIIRQIPDIIDLDKALEEAKSSMLPDANTKEAKIVRKAAAALGCDSEACVLTSSQVKASIGNDVINREIAIKFKETGPRNSSDWLSNINIDKTLQKWAVEFDDLYVYPFCMSDFYKTKGSLATIRPCDVLAGKASQKIASGTVTRPCKRMCCVLNTDVSTGRGIHWVCMFVDCTKSPITIEYFNSAGNPPFLNAVKWMEQTRAEFMKSGCAGTVAVDTISVTSVPHQESDSECGVYCLFYIRKRLEGTPLQYFMDKRIPDADMSEFRKYLFR